ncbi:MAG: phosphatidate cytidylyltransferase [Candidatus Lokiarchaeota archaeon]
MVIHIIRSWNSEKKELYKKINEIIYALLTFFFGIYYPFILLYYGDNFSGILFPSATSDFIFFGDLFIVGGIFTIFLWALSAKLRVMKNPTLKKTTNNYQLFCEEFLNDYENCSTKNKIKRKCYHTLPFAVVGTIILVFYNFRSFLGTAWFSYAAIFIVILGIDFAFTFLIGDLVRLLGFSWMPPNASKLFRAGMTDQELDSFTSTSVMVFGFGPFIFAPFPIFIIILLVTAVADACASISGLLAGNNKHNFPKKSDKSLEGYIGGTIATFLCAIIGVLFSNLFGLSNWLWNKILFVALISSITFLLIDLITSKIKLQDNYVNPIAIGIILILTISML